jgi:hypothetical protein
MTCLTRVFDIFWGLTLTPPGIEVLDARKLGLSDVLGRTHYALRSEQLPYQAVMQDALGGAAVELF